MIWGSNAKTEPAARATNAPLTKNAISYQKTDFRPVFRVSGQRKNDRFSVIPVGTGSVGPPYHIWVFQPSFVDLGPKLGVLQKALCPPPKMAKIRPGGRKTARRAAERPPTGKPKLSRVTSGCGEDIIPLSRVRETPKNGGYMGVA